MLRIRAFDGRPLSLLMLIAGLFLLFSPTGGGAESSVAEAEVRDMVARLLQDFKTKRSAAVILDAVHWQSAFDSFPKDERARINVRTADELRTHYERALINPAEYARTSLERQMAVSSPSEREKLKRMMALFSTKFEEQLQRMRNQIGNADFDIKDIQVNGSDAVVGVGIKLEGEEERVNKLALRRLADPSTGQPRWYLLTPSFARSASQAPLS